MVNPPQRRASHGGGSNPNAPFHHPSAMEFPYFPFTPPHAEDRRALVLPRVPLPRAGSSSPHHHAFVPYHPPPQAIAPHPSPVVDLTGNNLNAYLLRTPAMPQLPQEQQRQQQHEYQEDEQLYTEEEKSILLDIVQRQTKKLGQAPDWKRIKTIFDLETVTTHHSTASLETFYTRLERSVLCLVIQDLRRSSDEVDWKEVKRLFDRTLGSSHRTSQWLKHEYTGLEKILLWTVVKELLRITGDEDVDWIQVANVFHQACGLPSFRTPENLKILFQSIEPSRDLWHWDESSFVQVIRNIIAETSNARLHSNVDHQLYATPRGDSQENREPRLRGTPPSFRDSMRFSPHEKSLLLRIVTKLHPPSEGKQSIDWKKVKKAFDKESGSSRHSPQALSMLFNSLQEMARADAKGSRYSHQEQNQLKKCAELVKLERGEYDWNRVKKAFDHATGTTHRSASALQAKFREMSKKAVETAAGRQRPVGLLNDESAVNSRTESTSTQLCRGKAAVPPKRKHKMYIPNQGHQDANKRQKLVHEESTKDKTDHSLDTTDVHRDLACLQSRHNELESQFAGLNEKIQVLFATGDDHRTTVHEALTGLIRRQDHLEFQLHATQLHMQLLLLAVEKLWGVVRVSMDEDIHEHA